MKHNNLKKPAAVLTALALAAALLAGCGAPSDSMAASSAPAESEAVSTETPLKAQTREMQTKWPQRNVQT